MSFLTGIIPTKHLSQQKNPSRNLFGSGTDIIRGTTQIRLFLTKQTSKSTIILRRDNGRTRRHLTWFAVSESEYLLIQQIFLL